ncbi:hypothetical protein Mapa_012280 [Marchantia paleacea]|nr:hypothetical protein Mapa_012280 [Marchantia paleacea]
MEQNHCSGRTQYQSCAAFLQPLRAKGHPSLQSVRSSVSQQRILKCNQSIHPGIHQGFCKRLRQNPACRSTSRNLSTQNHLHGYFHILERLASCRILTCNCWKY